MHASLSATFDPLFHLAVINFSHYCNIEDSCILTIYWCFFQEVTEDLDPSLKPILLQNTYVKGGHTLIKIGDTEIEYNSNFRFVKSTCFLQICCKYYKLAGDPASIRFLIINTIHVMCNHSIIAIGRSVYGFIHVHQ